MPLVETVVSIVGAVLNSIEEATRNQKAFVASTGIQEINSSNKLVAVFGNPVDSGVNMFLYNRLFSNNRRQDIYNLKYQAVLSPTVDLENDSQGINTTIGGEASDVWFSWGVIEKSTDLGGTVGSGEVLPNGKPYSRPLLSIIPPGYSLGFYIQGVDSAINSPFASITLEWYEEPV